VGEVALNVVLLRHTPEPEEVVAMAARLCYSPASVEQLREKVAAADQAAFVERLAAVGHLSPIEHVSFTFGVEGISRACSHQLVRHRLASYSQQSQRYVRAEQFDFVVPPSLAADPEARAEFLGLMAAAQAGYARLLASLAARGVTGEAAQQDARFALPNAAETKIVLTMNARELLHFFRVRTCNRAQWEIRRMAEAMLALARAAAPTIFARSGPPCLHAPCPEGKHSCGKAEEVRRNYGVRKLPG
jgi:thymidylate synthase (FAD)